MFFNDEIFFMVASNLPHSFKFLTAVNKQCVTLIYFGCLLLCNPVFLFCLASHLFNLLLTNNTKLHRLKNKSSLNRSKYGICTTSFSSMFWF